MWLTSNARQKKSNNDDKDDNFLNVKNQNNDNANKSISSEWTHMWSAKAEPPSGLFTMK